MSDEKRELYRACIVYGKCDGLFPSLSLVTVRYCSTTIAQLFILRYSTYSVLILSIVQLYQSFACFAACHFRLTQNAYLNRHLPLPQDLYGGVCIDIDIFDYSLDNLDR